MSATTIRDIAVALGVTPSTVSRALSGNPYVKESTRAAILKKARELGYERNVMASNLRKGTTNIVGIIVPRINREFFGNVISGAESLFSEAGYSVVICQTHERLEDEKAALKVLAGEQVAGIMISHSSETVSGEHILDAIGESVKLVQFDRVIEGLPGSTVINDDFKGAYTATKHLIDNGYKRIGALVGFMDTILFKRRYEGYAAALADAGMPLDPDIVYENTILRENGYESTVKAIAAGCDAIYSSGDFSARGALECALKHGLKVPEDFGIVGTANETFTSLVSPRMSSVDQHPFEMGRSSASAMIRLLSGETQGEEILIGTTLVTRQSSTR